MLQECRIAGHTAHYNKQEPQSGELEAQPTYRGMIIVLLTAPTPLYTCLRAPHPAALSVLLMALSALDCNLSF